MSHNTAFLKKLRGTYDSISLILIREVCCIWVACDTHESMTNGELSLLLGKLGALLCIIVASVTINKVRVVPRKHVLDLWKEKLPLYNQLLLPTPWRNLLKNN